MATATELREWMAPTIHSVQPWCDEAVIAAATFQVAGGWASGVSNGLIGALVVQDETDAAPGRGAGACVAARRPRP